MNDFEKELKDNNEDIKTAQTDSVKIETKLDDIPNKGSNGAVQKGQEEEKVEGVDNVNKEEEKSITQKTNVSPLVGTSRKSSERMPQAKNKENKIESKNQKRDKEEEKDEKSDSNDSEAIKTERLTGAGSENDLNDFVPVKVVSTLHDEKMISNY
jgi:hypothetical protein